MNAPNLKPVEVKPPPKKRVELIPFDQICLGTEPRYLVQGIIPRAGLIVVYGPPKSGKSFLTFDMVMQVALGRQYRGRPTRQGAVIYAAFEGQDGIRARVEAFRQRHLSEEATGVPFYLQPLRLDLVMDVQALIAGIRETLQAVMPIAIVLDTLNKSLHGSENSDEDMGAYVRAADALRETFDCAVIIVHHSGLEGSRPRGHTSLTGAADAQLAVKRDPVGNVLMTVEWMKDGPEGETITSRLESVEVGMDSAGQAITSCVVVPAEPVTVPTAGPHLTANQRSFLGILRDAGPAGLTVDEWNAKARQEGLGVKRRTDLMDLRKTLRDKRLVHTYAERWYVSP